MPALWIIPPLSGGHCIMYLLRLFMAKAFTILKLMTCTGWGAVSTIFKSLVWPGLEPKTSPFRSRCATTEPNLLGKWNIRMKRNLNLIMHAFENHSNQQTGSYQPKSRYFCIYRGEEYTPWSIQLLSLLNRDCNLLSESLWPDCH